MPFGEVKLVAGVNVERTPTLLEAGYSASQLIRFKDGLAQKYGGWQAYYNGTASGIPRDLHAYEDLNGNTYLAVATTSQLAVITSGVLTDITPQTLTTNPAVSVDTTGGSSTLFGFTDPGINAWFSFGGTTISPILAGIDAIIVNVPIAINSRVLSGYYPISKNITEGAGTTQTWVDAAVNAQSLVTASGAVPQFATTSNSNIVKVTLTNHGLSFGQEMSFNVSTAGNGVTIFGEYNVFGGTGVTAPYQITNNVFYILCSTTANATGSFNMNGGNAQYIYLLGTGFYPGNEQTGSKITSTDWTQDNWGQILLSCPSNGAIYQWQPGVTQSANPVSSAPVKNGGIFISNAQQVLICWGSSGAPGLTQTLSLNPTVVSGSLGISQNTLQVTWSTVGDYTVFTPLSTNQAGSFVIPAGSTVRGGMAVANQNLIWTDLDLWAMNYIGFPLVYGFNKIGSGAGLISSHAAAQMRGNVYWMGPTNFYVHSNDGVRVIECPIWDVVFQNLNTAFTSNIRAMPNTPFNEMGWLYPSSASVSGECDSYVKFNITEQGFPWDYGTISRSAWIDQTILGNPIAGDSSGNIWQHEMTNDAGGSPMTSSFTTGYFYIAEGEEFAFVDLVIPDMKWGFFGAAQTASVQITFNVINYPGDTPITYGPYTMTNTTQSISTRFRGRQMSMTLQSSDSGSFWRIGKLRYRYSADGRR